MTAIDTAAASRLPDSLPVVAIRGVTKSFGANQVLKGVDLDVRKGEVVSVIGPSGSGKTTLLRCINFLESYDGGSIKVDGVEVGYRDDRDRRRPRSERELAKIRAETAMVFQMFNLFPHLTAAENVMLGLRKVRRMEKPKARAVAERWLDRVGLADKRDSLPAQLSGGQQSASASPGPSPWTPRSCCSTRSPRRSIPSWSARCWRWCASSPTRA